MAREERTFWVPVYGGIEQRVGLATGQNDYWWFPDVGMPGWGTSMKVGYGCFESREHAIRHALEDAYRSRARLDERIAKLEALRDA